MNCGKKEGKKDCERRGTLRGNICLNGFEVDYTKRQSDGRMSYGCVSSSSWKWNIKANQIQVGC